MVSKSLDRRVVPKKRLMGSLSTGGHDSDGDVVLGDQRLQHPRRNAVAAARRLQRRLDDQRAFCPSVVSRPWRGRSGPIGTIAV